MPPGYLCKSFVRCMWLVSLSCESQLSTEECISLPSPDLFTVCHPHGIVRNNTQIWKGIPQLQSRAVQTAWRPAGHSPQTSHLQQNKTTTLFYSLVALGFPVLMPVPAPPANSFQTRSAETAKPAPNIPTSFWSFQPSSLTFDRNIKLWQLTVQWE